MDTLLNGFVVGALFFFVLTLAGLLWVITALIPQLTKTLTAYERLAITLEAELQPTLQEVQKVIVGITELKTIATKNVSEVTTKVEDVTDNLTKVVGSAKKSSSAWGVGLLAGAKAYLEGNSSSKDHSSQEHAKKQITMSRGE